VPVFSRDNCPGIVTAQSRSFNGSRREVEKRFRPVDAHRGREPGQKLIGLNAAQKFFIRVEVHGTGEVPQVLVREKLPAFFQPVADRNRSQSITFHHRPRRSDSLPQISPQGVNANRADIRILNRGIQGHWLWQRTQTDP